MSKILQLRRYDPITLATITGADGELIIDEWNHLITIHDGITPGGHIIGMMGPTGNTGLQGLPGANGANGEQGLIGLTGNTANLADLLPANSVGYLYNDGNGVLSWSTVNSTSTQMAVSTKQTVDFTLSNILDNTIIPVAANVTITVPADTLANSFSVLLMQDDHGPITLQAAPGVIINSPNGLTTNGQYTSITLIQIRNNTWLASATQQDTSMANTTTTIISGGGGGGTMTIAPVNQPGLIIYGGANSNYVMDSGIVTVTKSSAHGFTAAHNGMSIFLLGSGTDSFGFLDDPTADVSLQKYYEICTNFTYINSTTFTCATQKTSTSSSGTLQPISNPNWWVPAITLTIPGGTLQNNGYFKTVGLVSHNGSNGLKSVSFNWGHTKIKQAKGTTYQMDSTYILDNNLRGIGGFEIHNQNSQGRQVYSPGVFESNGFGYAPSGQPKRFTKDTSVDSLFTFGVSLPTPNDWIIIEFASLELYPKA